MVKLEEFDKNKLEEYKQRILKTEKFVEGKKFQSTNTLILPTACACG